MGSSLLRYFSLKSSRDANDPIFRTERTLSLLRHDIFLLENQLPFFVLSHLFNITKTDEDHEDLISLVLCFADKMFLNLSVSSRVSRRLAFKNIDHLCGLIHDVFCFPAPWYSCKRNEGENLENIDSAASLREAGIRFKNVEESGSFMDISFFDGVLQIPHLSIYDETESQLRNMATHEQYLPGDTPKYISDYLCFMHRLINTSDDVKLLRTRGIIKNWLGDDEKVCAMFNKLGRDILTSPDFSYTQVFNDVNSHCRRRRKKWTANLCRTHFNSPWSIISLLAAVILLLFTANGRVILAVISHFLVALAMNFDSILNEGVVHFEKTSDKWGKDMHGDEWQEALLYL
ncbi:hypothetical protein BUALT_Bualt14G0101700 [Buddleja alternifolia]|uniref:Uncharacterized protein n=1 Tax=Buddleja alternifolia TaxID=168488 RepID=A0AAV6WQF4_9LAMI|nr:hypothetical protein BUALT_Bualt14G0101700 [Buddleja alternifolia]